MAVFFEGPRNALYYAVYGYKLSATDKDFEFALRPENRPYLLECTFDYKPSWYVSTIRYSCLEYAVKRGNLEDVKTIVEAGADLTKSPNGKGSILHFFVDCLMEKDDLNPDILNYFIEKLPSESKSTLLDSIFKYIFEKVTETKTRQLSTFANTLLHIFIDEVIATDALDIDSLNTLIDIIPSDLKGIWLRSALNYTLEKIAEGKTEKLWKVTEILLQKGVKISPDAKLKIPFDYLRAKYFEHECDGLTILKNCLRYAELEKSSNSQSVCSFKDEHFQYCLVDITQRIESRPLSLKFAVDRELVQGAVAAFVENLNAGLFEKTLKGQKQEACAEIKKLAQSYKKWKPHKNDPLGSDFFTYAYYFHRIYSMQRNHTNFTQFFSQPSWNYIILQTLAHGDKLEQDLLLGCFKLWNLID